MVERVEKGPETWITIREVAEKLGLPEHEIRRRIKAGEFNSRIESTKERSGRKGRPRITVPLREVEWVLSRAKKTAKDAPSPSLADRYTPEDASRVFAELKKGVSMEDIVIDLKIHPSAVIAISRAWDEIRGSVTLGPDAIRRIRKAGVDAEDPLPANAAEALTEAIEVALKEQACVTCNKPARYCTSCMRVARKEAHERAAHHAPAPPPQVNGNGATHNNGAIHKEVEDA